MKQKKTFIILGAIGLVLVVFWVVVLALVVKTVRGWSTEVDRSPGDCRWFFVTRMPADCALSTLARTVLTAW